MITDTIAAIATPVGAGGIAVVRISGPDSARITDQLFRCKKYASVSEMAGYTSAFGRVYDEQGAFDEAVAAVFTAPHSYTGETVVEISIHGGVYLARRLLRASVAAGARLAQAGEFTRRAFLNGKLDLTRAESVMDLIGAQSDQAAKAALAAHDGALFRYVSESADRLAAIAAELCAWIDYPEEDMDAPNYAAILSGLREVGRKLSGLLATYDTGHMIREGIETVIIGKPNTGKSTLMNLLAGYQRSIVTDIAGTTRDIVTDTVQLGSYMLRLSDTAGIHQTVDVVEKTGVGAAIHKIDYAQLIIAVFDGSTVFSKEDREIVRYCKDKPVLALVNKNDLPQQIEMEEIMQSFSHVVSLSANEAQSRELIEDALEQIFRISSLDAGAAMLANERQYEGVHKAQEETMQALDALEQGVSYDAVTVCIESALEALLILTGKRASEAVVSEIFSRFCVGK